MSVLKVTRNISLISIKSLKILCIYSYKSVYHETALTIYLEYILSLGYSILKC